MRQSFTILSLAVAATAMVVGTASASIIVTKTSDATFALVEGTNNTPSAGVVSSTDLLDNSQGNVASSSTSGTLPDYFSLSSLTDGVNGIASGNWSGVQLYDVTYNLNVGANPSGYDIASVSVVTNWGDGRKNQRWELSYSLVGNAAFTSLGTFDFSLISTPVQVMVPLTANWH